MLCLQGPGCSVKATLDKQDLLCPHLAHHQLAGFIVTKAAVVMFVFHTLAAAEAA